MDTKRADSVSVAAPKDCCGNKIGHFCVSSCSYLESKDGTDCLISGLESKADLSG